MSKRFVRKEDLPSSLFCRDKKIMLLPDKLIELWKNLLHQNGLEKAAKEKAEKGFEGGISKEDTDKHLAWRYNGSCGRVILSMLDPKQQLAKISDTYASIFSGDRVFLADLPSGSGAAVVSILTTFAELRKHGALPRIPLTVVIVAGEISETAREYLNYQLSQLKNPLRKQAIWIEYEVRDWNVLDKMSTTDLVKSMLLKGNDCKAKLLLLSNFTGFLERGSKWKEAKPQFDEIFRYSRDNLSAAIWIEPQKNNVNTFRTRIIDWFSNLFKQFLPQKPVSEEDYYAKSSSEFRQPIKKGNFPVRLTVMKFDLPIESVE